MAINLGRKTRAQSSATAARLYGAGAIPIPLTDRACPRSVGSLQGGMKRAWKRNLANWPVSAVPMSTLTCRTVLSESSGNYYAHQPAKIDQWPWTAASLNCGGPLS
jgi:hypothetical protein